MSRMFYVIALLALSSAAFGQKLVIELDTLEGQMLQQIDGEQDATKKIALLETFARQFPNHEAATWVLSNIQQFHLQNKEYDKVFADGTKILSIDPLELSAAHNCLKAAEGKKDLALIKLWSAQTSQIARKVMQLSVPNSAMRNRLPNGSNRWNSDVRLSSIPSIRSISLRCRQRM